VGEVAACPETENSPCIDTLLVSSVLASYI
jgi:hypothetical protein